VTFPQSVLAEKGADLKLKLKSQNRKKCDFPAAFNFSVLTFHFRLRFSAAC